MTLRQLHATMANPWWHLCEECRRLHVADADKSNGVVIFGKCGKCKSGLDRKEPLPGLLSDRLAVTVAPNALAIEQGAVVAGLERLGLESSVNPRHKRPSGL